MKKIALASILLTLGGHSFANADLSKLQLSKKTINQVEFPRDYEYRFRGQEAELYTLDDALKAFFGDKTSYIETLEFSAISLLIQNKFWHMPNEDKKLTNMRRAFCKDWSDRSKTYDSTSKDCYQLDNKITEAGKTLRSEINEIIKQKRIYTEAEAKKLAQDILDKQFKQESHNSKLNRLINYESGRYEDFPVDVIFSTVYPQNAAIYGDNILVLKEDKTRSIDLSFFNGITNNNWGIWGDAGEYITPGYIKADELAGIHLRKRGEYPDRLRHRVRINEYSAQKNMPIEFAFYKKVKNGKTYVLVFDGEIKGRDSKCIKPNEKGEIVHCRLTRPNHNFNGNLVLIGNQALAPNTKYFANIIGVLVLHEVGTTAENVDHILSEFKYTSHKELDFNLKNSNNIGEQSPDQTIKSFRMNIGSKTYQLSLIKAGE